MKDAWVIDNHEEMSDGAHMMNPATIKELEKGDGNRLLQTFEIVRKGKMAGKKTNNKPVDRQAQRRIKIMQVVFIIFSLMLILSMVLSAVSKF